MKKLQIALALALLLAVAVVAGVGAWSHSPTGTVVDVNASTGAWVVTPAQQFQGTSMVIEVRPAYKDSWGRPTYINGCAKYLNSVGNSVTGKCAGATTAFTWVYRASDLFVLDSWCDGPACY